MPVSLHHLYVTVLILPVNVSVLITLSAHVNRGGHIKLVASRMLGKIFEQKYREIAKGWRKLYNENVPKA